MGSWIFQANPKIFDIRGFFATCSGEFTWRVRRYKGDIKKGDMVYIWVSAGEKNNPMPAGVIAKALVVGAPKPQAEQPEASSFYIEPPSKIETRAVLRLIRVAKQKEIIQRKWLQEDSILSQMLIMKQASGTNFPLKQSEAIRLDELWARTGKPWSEYEVMEALQLYESLIGHPISKVSGSPVEQLSQKIGRAPTGVYNKLMNIRSLDPTVEQQGLSSGSKIDERIWERYYDSTLKKIKIDELNANLLRLTGTEVGTLTTAASINIDDEIKRLESKPLEVLLHNYNDALQTKFPTKLRTTTIAYARDPRVVAITQKRSNYSCEVPNCTNKLFNLDSGKPYIETHHIHMLADGGPDTIDNTIALCPQHHREVHFGQNRDSLRIKMLEVRSQCCESVNSLTKT